MTAPTDPPQSPDPSDYLNTLLNLSQLICSRLELNEVLETAIDLVIQFVGAERGFILLVDISTGRVWGEALRNITRADLEGTLSGRDPENGAGISKSIVERVLDYREAVISNNAMEDPRFSQHRSVQLAHLRSVLCVPLITSDRLLGVIYLDNRLQDGIFDEHKLDMLKAFAGQASVAIENARLYDNLRRSLDERLKLQDALYTQESRRLALEEGIRLKSDFVGYVAHELRNPLTSIRGYVQTLQMDGGAGITDDIRKEFYEAIETDADRLLDMINELLEISRLEAGRPLSLTLSEFSPRSVISRATRRIQFSSFFTKRHAIEVYIADDFPEAVIGDEDKLHQIMSNLLSNAAKYSPQGGEITVRAERTGEDSYSITITDQGVGMNDEQCGRLFRRYERVEREDIRNIPGTGLGLFLVKSLIDLQGGSVSCVSAPQKGSAFTVTLPIKVAPASTSGG
jgi:signal transduction histidine kinase